MDIKTLTQLNELWLPIYPYLAEWILQYHPLKAGHVLEIGPFSGGTGHAMTKRVGGLEVTCLVPEFDISLCIGNLVGTGIEMVVGSLEKLPFKPSFDIVVSRGAFFFLTPEIIRDAHRVMKPGAVAILGGGYGPLTPPEEIHKIAVESKVLNYQLGKKWISRQELKSMLRETGLERACQILEAGGLWLIVNN